MADLDENLVATLAADAAVSAITTNIYVNRKPDSQDVTDYIWIRSSNVEQAELGLSGDTNKDMFIETFEIECTSTTLDNAKDLQKAVGDELHGKTGSFGDQNIAFSDAIDQDDSYETRQDFGDNDNFHVCALTVEIGVDGR